MQSVKCLAENYTLIRGIETATPGERRFEVLELCLERILHEQLKILSQVGMCESKGSAKQGEVVHIFEGKLFHIFQGFKVLYASTFHRVTDAKAVCVPH